jgi:hypothetical protein
MLFVVFCVEQEPREGLSLQGCSEGLSGFDIVMC